mmetsp:Transcript_9312/g.27353  ORF Transcript_9312/g.27353 Transcript_9312/m.27353 type:complete len:285 (+) Transcript_9312:649-1503(+)
MLHVLLLHRLALLRSIPYAITNVLAPARPLLDNFVGTLHGLQELRLFERILDVLLCKGDILQLISESDLFSSPILFAEGLAKFFDAYFHVAVIAELVDLLLRRVLIIFAAAEDALRQDLDERDVEPHDAEEGVAAHLIQPHAPSRPLHAEKDDVIGGTSEVQNDGELVLQDSFVSVCFLVAVRIADCGRRGLREQANRGHWFYSRGFQHHLEAIARHVPLRRAKSARNRQGDDIMPTLRKEVLDLLLMQVKQVVSQALEDRMDYPGVRIMGREAFIFTVGGGGY